MMGSEEDFHSEDPNLYPPLETVDWDLNPDELIPLETVTGKVRVRRRDVVGYEYGPQGAQIFLREVAPLMFRSTETLEALDKKFGVAENGRD